MCWHIFKKKRGGKKSKESSLSNSSLVKERMLDKTKGKLVSGQCDKYNCFVSIEKKRERQKETTKKKTLRPFQVMSSKHIC